MEPSIFFPTSPPPTLDDSFDRSISFSPTADSLCPLLSAHELDRSALFDPHIHDKIPCISHYPFVSSPPSTSSPTPTSSERSSMEEPLIANSPSQVTITNAALRAETTKLKKKRSLGQALKSLRSSSRDFTDSLRGTKRVPIPLQLEDTSVLTIGSEILPGSKGVRHPEDEDGFDDRNRTVRRRNMPHHPFRSEDAPYMQAYSQVLLESDYQTHQLLCRLALADSPTFHKFGKKPPAEVLDLGCGEGFWVLHAAKLWKSANTKVTGLDLIDVHNNEVGEVHPHLEPAHVPKNVTWTRANFVKYPLPFPDNSFDLVRMANLTLCIPISRWKFVLTQVRRVLRPGGRLELIDDELFFPAVLPRPSRDILRSPSRCQWQRSTSDNLFGVQRSTSLARSLSHKAAPDLPSPNGSPNSKYKKGHSRSPSDVEFSTNTAIATHIETIFTNMLANKYGITPRPHVFLMDLLREVFGSDCARETRKLELAVPSRELSQSYQNLGLNSPSLGPSPTTPGHAKRASEDEKYKLGWMSLDWEKKGKRSGRSSPIHVALPTGARSERWSDEDSAVDVKVDAHLAGSLTPKARQLLFGECEKGARPPSWRANGPYQPPGLVLLRPSTLIPFSPEELEMHACKHMNALLGCKYALGKYVAGQKGADGQPLVSEKEVDDYLWDYECSRRKRFHWPQDVPALQMDDEPEESVLPTPPAKPNIFNKLASAGTGTTPPAADTQRTLSCGAASAPPMYGGVDVSRQPSTHVRTIRVWEAVKAHHCAGCHCAGGC